MCGLSAPELVLEEGRVELRIRRIHCASLAMPVQSSSTTESEVSWVLVGEVEGMPGSL